MKKELEEQWKREQDEINSRTKSEVERLKAANSSVIKEIDEKVEAAEKEIREKLRAQSKAANSELATTQREHKKMMAELADLSAAAAPIDFHAKAKEQILEIELKIKEQKMKLRGCRRSKFEELAEPQLQVKVNELRQVFQWTRDKIAANKELTAGWEKKLIKKFNDKYTPPDADKMDEWIVNKAKEIAKPPTPEPEPVKKKWGDDDDEAGDDEEDAGSESAPPSSEAPPSESSEDIDDFDPDDVPVNADGKKPIDKGELSRALERDQQLGQLLEQIVDYLVKYSNGLATRSLQTRSSRLGGKRSSSKSSTTSTPHRMPTRWMSGSSTKPRKSPSLPRQNRSPSRRSGVTMMTKLVMTRKTLVASPRRQAVKHRQASPARTSMILTPTMFLLMLMVRSQLIRANFPVLLSEISNLANCSNRLSII
ncbi:Hypothetical protein, putative [Bodo saltans]|uniref:Uncharacterized protein n=1 Tax=Bodo saltans TaxID=75058 RepID=A0A0S4IWK2_BODSA|nr:Hypothetical protein, putative [Bodo saltans]|eukprot:CUG30052.1 Hypothetical protein, putative [Bodo saltans]